MSAENILVTGGAGYIGSHTCKALAEQNYTPVTFDNFIYGHRSAVKWGPLVEGDLADKALLLNTLKTYRIEAVIHFAAYAYVGESMANPGKYFQNNVVNTLTLLEAMREAGVSEIVFSSSCATYGNPVRLPIDEAHPQRPVNPYGESKLFVERALHWYAQAHAFRYAALRYFNAAGADIDGEIGEAHEPETHLIPLVIGAALGHRGPVQIFGTDYPTPDGTAIRDYIHVTDLAKAHVQSLKRLKEGEKTIVANLGTGRGYSVREVIATVQAVSGCIVPFSEAARRAGDPPELVADPSKANRLLGWTPQYSDLPTIVGMAWDWHRTSRNPIRARF